jgi:LysM repeat protein
LTKKRTSHDQAEELRKQIKGPGKKANELDVLSLPPRSEVHKNTKKKTKWKIKYPVIRLLAIFFILLPISILSIYYLYDNKPVRVIKLNENESYETVDIADDNQGEKNGSNIDDNLPQHEIEMSEINSSVEVDKESEAQEKIEAEMLEESEQKVIHHIVQENETLFSIAMKYYQTDEGMEIIKEWNHLSSSQLYKGQVLKIPVFEMSK